MGAIINRNEFGFELDQGVNAMADENQKEMIQASPNPKEASPKAKEAPSKAQEAPAKAKEAPAKGKEASPKKSKRRKKVKSEKVKSKKVKSKKVKKPSKMNLQNLALKIGIGTVVVLLEVGVCYTLVTQFLLPGDEKTSGEVSDSEAQDIDRTAAKGEQGNSSQTPRVVNNNPDEHVKIAGLFTLEDLVVNPAFTGGKRFFIVSMALAVELEEMLDVLKEREPIIKDRIIGLIAQKSFTWLANNANRETLRNEINTVVENIIRSSGGVRVYFTKYVLK